MALLADLNYWESLTQANREERESCEDAGREMLAADEETRRSAMLTEWGRISLPPQNEQVNSFN